MHDKKNKIKTIGAVNSFSRGRLAALVIAAAFTLPQAACIMSWQYRIERDLVRRAGDQRFDAAQFSAIDARALGAPLSAAGSFEKLAEYLTGPAIGDLQKVRALWRWITSNIEYDTGKKNYSAAETLRDRKGTCQGYAELFVELCRRCGIRAVEITGYNRGAGYNPGDRVYDDHAWNAVLIGEKWYLLDCTDGAGFIRNGGFIRDYREHYFLTPPDEFIYGNLPTVPRWQLLLRKITRKEFESLPMYRYGYFQYNLRQLDDNLSCVIRSGRELTLRFAAPAGIRLTAAVRTISGAKSSDPVVTRSGDIIQITAAFPDPGEYHLIGWAGPENAPGSRSWAFTYLVRVEYHGGSLKKTPRLN